MIGSQVLHVRSCSSVRIILYHLALIYNSWKVSNQFEVIAQSSAVQHAPVFFQGEVRLLLQDMVFKGLLVSNVAQTGKKKLPVPGTPRTVLGLVRSPNQTIQKPAGSSRSQGICCLDT